jgi:predicted metal-dependent peptidase
MPVVTQQQQLSSVVRIRKARTTLLLDHPFFGTLLFRLGARPLGSIKTMATDGVSLFFNPDFVDTLNAAELAGVLAHEVMHPALQHHTRRADRDPKRWNMACDYAINPMLLEAGLTLPKDVLLDPRFGGMSAERIYNLIEEQENQDGSCSEQESSVLPQMVLHPTEKRRPIIRMRMVNLLPRPHPGASVRCWMHRSRKTVKVSPSPSRHVNGR